MAIDNCRKCGAIFQRVQSPMCRTCEESVQSKRTDLYRYIHDNPGMDIQILAEKFELKVTELERMIYSGDLGTASQLIKFHCTRCKVEMPPGSRVGYFCDNCQKSVATEVQTTKKEPEPGPAHSPANSLYTYKPAKPQEDCPPRERPAEAPPEPDSKKQFGFKRIS